MTKCLGQAVPAAAVLRTKHTLDETSAHVHRSIFNTSHLYNKRGTMNPFSNVCLMGNPCHVTNPLDALEV